MADIQFAIEAIDRFTSTFRNLDSQLNQAYSAAGTMGKGMMAAGAAVGTGLGFAVKTAADFEKGISRVGALSGATDKELQQMTNTALHLGETTSYSATQASEAMSYLAMAGYKTNDVIDAMPGLLAGAAAGQTDLAATADITSNILSGFGIAASDTGKVMDVLTATFTNSNTDLSMLGETMKYLAPGAKAAGQSLEEMAAATGILGNAGIQGTMAGTSMAMALTRLASPAKRGAEMMEKLGFNAFDAQGNMKPFSQIITELTDKTKDLTQQQKMQAVSHIFGQEAMKSILTLMEAGGDTIAEFAGELENSGGIAEDIANKQLDNLSGQLTLLSSAFEGAGISIGNALLPAIKGIVSGIQWLLDAFNSLSPGMKSFLAIGAAVSAILMILGGGVLWVVSLIPGVIGGFTAIAGAMNLTAGVLSVTIGWIFLAIAAVVAIGVVLYKAYQNVGWFRDMVNNAWAQIKSYWGVAVDWIKGKTTQVIGAVSAFIGQQLDKIRSWWSSHGSQVMSIVKNFMQVTQTVVKAGLNFIKGIFQAVFPIIENIVKVAWTFISTYIDTAINVILRIINIGMALLQGDWSSAWQNIKGIAVDIVNGIVNFFKGIDLFQVGKDIIGGLVKGIGSMASAVGDAVAGIAKGIPAGVKKLLNIHSPSRIMHALGEFTGIGLANGIADMQRLVRKSSETLAAAAIQEPIPMQPTIAPIRRGQAFTGDAAVAASNVTQPGSTDSAEYYFEIPVVIDGREVARATARFTEEELERMKTKKNRAAGITSR
ncbi:phage tail tape measure protein [Bacillus sp. AG4(2022)]|uniref:phage tail tape measure protein n=1 Tax=Bacillus sp. AG4(2022) TaxID=2962594 RepID=UPI0028812FEE|nr:phage tail tape measure protein [Bacillus sp. AG4(2022)]MDT0161869.1 phage tail tape measure protein [Bacillus sp. AG4(2022)]